MDEVNLANFRPESMATFTGIPTAIDHHPGAVTW